MVPIICKKNLHQSGSTGSPGLRGKYNSHGVSFLQQAGPLCNITKKGRVRREKKTVTTEERYSEYDAGLNQDVQ